MINKIILLGHAGKEPESRDVNGNIVTSFTLATNESYKDKSGNKHTSTEWHNIVVWGPLAKVAADYIKKGNLVYLEGKVQTRSWDDKDGNKRYTTEVNVRELKLMPQGQSQSEQAAPEPGNDLSF